jgi:hypothetical protein
MLLIFLRLIKGRVIFAAAVVAVTFGCQQTSDEFNYSALATEIAPHRPLENATFGIWLSALSSSLVQLADATEIYANR